MHQPSSHQEELSRLQANLRALSERADRLPSSTVCCHCHHHHCQCAATLPQQRVRFGDDDVDFHRISASPLLIPSDANGKAVISALRALQDKIKRLELEKSAAEVNFHKLEAQTKKFKELISRHDDDEPRPSTKPTSSTTTNSSYSRNAGPQCYNNHAPRPTFCDHGSCCHSTSGTAGHHHVQQTLPSAFDHSHAQKYSVQQAPSYSDPISSRDHVSNGHSVNVRQGSSELLASQVSSTNQHISQTNRSVLGTGVSQDAETRSFQNASNSSDVHGIQAHSFTTSDGVQGIRGHHAASASTVGPQDATKITREREGSCGIEPKGVPLVSHSYDQSNDNINPVEPDTQARESTKSLEARIRALEKESRLFRESVSPKSTSQRPEEKARDAADGSSEIVTQGHENAPRSAPKHRESHHHAKNPSRKADATYKQDSTVSHLVEHPEHLMYGRSRPARVPSSYRTEFMPTPKSIRYPFVVAKATTPSFSLPINMQRVMALLKNYHPAAFRLLDEDICGHQHPGVYEEVGRQLRRKIRCLEDELGRLAFQYDEEQHSATTQELDALAGTMHRKAEEISSLKKRLRAALKLAPHKMQLHKMEDINVPSREALREAKKIQRSVQSTDLSWDP